MQIFYINIIILLIFTSYNTFIFEIDAMRCLSLIDQNISHPRLNLRRRKKNHKIGLNKKNILTELITSWDHLKFTIKSLLTLHNLKFIIL